MTELYCGRCKQTKPVAAFNKAPNIKRGYQTWCKACASAYAKDKYADPASTLHPTLLKRRLSVIALIRERKDVPCHDCGKRYHYCVMDFDHRPGEVKLFAVSSGEANRDLLLAEIAKCDVVCANCHRIRTWSRKNASSKENAVL